MISTILGLMVGRGVSIVAIVTAALMAIWGWSYAQQVKGAKKERQRIEKIATKINKKARAAAMRARDDPSSVLEKYYRD